MSIAQWPEAERPREKLLTRGPSALSDAELLAIFLRTGCAGKSAVDLARDLLVRFNGLRPLLEADQDAFCSGEGLGPAKYAQLQAVLEMGRRHLSASMTAGDLLTSPDLVRSYLSSQLRHRRQEVFAVLFLDNQHRLLAYEELFFGTIDGASVYPREVVKEALSRNAAAVILAHNHPSGVAEPSGADRRITERLQQALDLVGVRVLDHMVVGDGEVVSFAERGWL
ncbi:DNA repair protein RadC [Marinimicrobium sp. ABcell2]|uniref:RadC family protein n=1 Tax=Marinimicrobium sp. ABcell2 TaxID=3069751 RepID=UPI0027B3B703|nr:DNA repair protein RadC [Marinimicrobium sp. ABcell2]MDQ2076706.1 DNA repair protein RadC [Marinimicrobium sp. ABcell2]